MEFIIRGDKIKVTDSMKNYIEEKLGKLEKYLKDGDSVRANVVVKVRNKTQIVEITIPLKTIILRSEESQDDFYKAVDKTIDKLERQLRKNKTRLSKHNKSNKEFMIIDEEEAILQMELLGHQFYMYLDSDKEKYCVVYKRKEGGYGVLES